MNSDAMQLYDGLPIITNKITTTERAGVPHHLLGHIPLHELPWDVEDFKREATKVIREIRERGSTPILVGGTQYYIDPLLFSDVILDDVQHSESSKSFPILEQPTPVLLEELKKCDPVMAERWHPNDRRKILRSLEIFLHTGKPASKFYEEQKERKSAYAKGDENGSGPWEKLLFWVYSDRDVLKGRLDSRVDKMMQAGLMQEVRDLHQFRREREGQGTNVDMTKGIWQAIGYKQLEPYLQAVEAGKDFSETERLLSSGLENMKTATRRYANYQTKWIKSKQMRRLQEEGPDAIGSLYLLDSTDVSRFQSSVVEPAAALVHKFLQGDKMPPPTELSDRALEVLAFAKEPPEQETPSKRKCELCNMVLVTEQAWQRHVKGAGHRRAEKKKKKLALVRTEPAPHRDDTSDVSRASSPGVGSLFEPK